MLDHGYEMSALVEQIAQRTADLVLACLYERSRDEMTVLDICREYGISRQTIHRRVTNGLLPRPRRRGGRSIWRRSAVIQADLDGRL